MKNILSSSIYWRNWHKENGKRIIYLDGKAITYTVKMSILSIKSSHERNSNQKRNSIALQTWLSHIYKYKWIKKIQIIKKKTMEACPTATHENTPQQTTLMDPRTAPEDEVSGSTIQTEEQ